MRIDVPGLTPEMCQARADWLRMCCAETLLHLALPALDVIDAALMEQYPARPELRVGDLALCIFGAREKVLCIDGDEVWMLSGDGHRFTRNITNLTPTGEPAPDDWGQG